MKVGGKLWDLGIGEHGADKFESKRGKLMILMLDSFWNLSVNFCEQDKFLQIP